jgi:hypothetical protein
LLGLIARLAKTPSLDYNAVCRCASARPASQLTGSSYLGRVGLAGLKKPVSRALDLNSVKALPRTTANLDPTLVIETAVLEVERYYGRTLRGTHLLRHWSGRTGRGIRMIPSLNTIARDLARLKAQATRLSSARDDTTREARMWCICNGGHQLIRKLLDAARHRQLCDL